ncbi:MAG: M48 family metallopeptidase, partial [Eubacterium sp.]|nr:M48 family metallopeptidase [Eubacterium sp.]
MVILGAIMEHVIFNGRKIEYCIIRKNVKNINLRIKQDCSVIVSANPLVPKIIIDAFVLENAEKILAVIEKNNAKAALKPDFEKGSTVKLLGKSYTLDVIESSTNSYYVGENEGDFIFT